MQDRHRGEVVAGDPASRPVRHRRRRQWPSRLEQAARPGEILIGTATYPLVKDAGTFGPRYRFSVKGKREPVEPFLEDVDATAAGYARRADAPFVGRERRYRGAPFPGWSRRSSSGAGDWSSCSGLRASASHGSCVEATAELGSHASVAMGRCLPYGTGITFWPLVEIVEEPGGVDALTGLLADVDDGLTIVEHIRAATGTGDDGAPSDEVFCVVRRLFEHLAESRPLVVCVDDVHGRSRPCSI